jgi:hypothetical protein
VLEVLSHAIHVAWLTLIAQYPHLLGDEYGRVRHDGDAGAELAERLLHRARALDAIVDRYRQTVALVNRTPDNDLPF